MGKAIGKRFFVGFFALMLIAGLSTATAFAKGDKAGGSAPANTLVTTQGGVLATGELEFDTPVETISFEPAKPYKLVANQDGYEDYRWDEEADEEVCFFHYDIPAFQEGDKLTVVGPGGSTSVYTWSYIGNDEDGEGVFVDGNGNALDGEVERRDTQDSKLWAIGDNYFDLAYLGQTCPVRVEVCAFAETIEVAGSLTLGSETSVTGSEGKYYAFTPTESGFYRVYSSDYVGDPWGAIYDESGEELASDDDGGKGWSFDFDAWLAAGVTYYVYAINYDDSANAKFTLHVEKPMVPVSITATLRNAAKLIYGSGDQGYWDWCLDDDYNEIERFRFYDSDVFEALNVTATYADGTTKTLGYFDVELSYDCRNWQPGNSYPVTVDFLGVSTTVDVPVAENPIGYISFEPKNPYVLIEGDPAACCVNKDADGVEYYWYWTPSFGKGDKLTINYKNGETVVYEYRMVESQDYDYCLEDDWYDPNGANRDDDYCPEDDWYAYNDENQDYDDHYLEGAWYGPNGEELPWYVEGSSYNQYKNHWTPESNNTFTVTCLDVSCDVPVAIAKSLANAVVTVADQTYTGKALEPAVIVKLDGKTLKSGTDYTVKYADNVTVGTATVTVTGKGSYVGIVKGSFKIAAVSISKAKVTLKKSSAAYTGKTQKGAVKFVVLNGKTLKSGTDYAVSAKSGKDVGSYAVTVTGKGNYAGTAKATFKVTQAKNTVKFAKAKVSKSYTVKKLAKKNASFKVKATGAKGDLTYTASIDKKAKKKLSFKNGKVTVKKGTAKGTYKMTITAKAAGNKNYKSGTAKTTVTVTVK